ncbi:hypothetical protein K474DRAFT_1710160 [Panus rudis PR-1116 ss-1]|nr:hypothetical protein K474DRAFT_1710160 [Panus rudis PR-1116 ss-1]
MLPLLLILCLCILSVQPQDFSVPSSWRKPTSDRPRDERIAIAQSVAHSVTYNETSGYVPTFYAPTQSAHWHCSLALHDWITGNNSNEATLKNHLSTVEATKSEQWPTENDPLTWGLAAYHAYRAYNDKSFLEIAQSFWNQATPYFITPENAASGTHPMRNISIQSQCNGSTTAGGVFWQGNVANSGIVTANAVGSYFVLSAYLFEATSNQTYSTAAGLSASFIQSHLYDGVLIKGRITIGPGDCVSVPSGGGLTYNSGLMIEGLGVYANVTGNDTLVDFLYNLIASTVKFQWSDDQGILYEETDSDNPSVSTPSWGYKGVFVRGLYEVWTRLPPDSDVAKLIESFILVQYNALQDLAKLSAGEFYSPVWIGPPPRGPLPWGQLAAIDVLNSAINLPTLNTTNPPGEAGDIASKSGAKSKIIAEVVGPVGGFIAIALLAIVVIYVRQKRRRQARPVSIIPLEEDEYAPRPFFESGSGVTFTYTPTIREYPPPKYIERPTDVHTNSPTTAGGGELPPYPDSSHGTVDETPVDNRQQKFAQALHGHVPGYRGMHENLQ